jgi:hypothetical protein
VRQAPAEWILPQGRRVGTLSLTSQRLVFEGPGRGPNAGGTRSVEVPIGRLRSAEVTGTGGGPALEVDLPQQRAVFRIAEPAAWATAIAQARGSGGAPPAPVAPPPPAAPAVVLRCRYCGTLNQPTVTRCVSCGAGI